MPARVLLFRPRVVSLPPVSAASGSVGPVVNTGPPFATSGAVGPVVGPPSGFTHMDIGLARVDWPVGDALLGLDLTPGDALEGWTTGDAIT